MMILALARFIESIVSITRRSSSIRPAAAADLTIAYSPDTLYTATGNSIAITCFTNNIQIGQGWFNHDNICTFSDIEFGFL